MDDTESPRDTALVAKLLLVPERGKFLPSHLGRDGLPRAKHPHRTEEVIGTYAGVVGGHEIFQALPLS